MESGNAGCVWEEGVRGLRLELNDDTKEIGAWSPGASYMGAWGDESSLRVRRRVCMSHRSYLPGQDNC